MTAMWTMLQPQWGHWEDDADDIFEFVLTWRKKRAIPFLHPFD